MLRLKKRQAVQTDLFGRGLLLVGLICERCECCTHLVRLEQL